MPKADQIVPHHIPFDLCSICVLMWQPTIEDKIKTAVRAKLRARLEARARVDQRQQGEDY